VFEELSLSDAEFRANLTAQLRWDKYGTTQATDAALRALFEQNPEMFDGTLVRARHILLAPAPGTDGAATLAGLRKQVEAEAEQALAKVPATADNLEREKVRAKALEEAFVKLAKAHSTCPSKEQGGDLGWFPRAGSMVEPFAKAAFATKVYQLSDPVTTQFGHHLILVVDRRPGKPTKFEDVKEQVTEVFFERLRDSLVGRLRSSAKVEVKN
jgi:parvulin-like peptidyl-prolyl isomerase